MDVFDVGNGVTRCVYNNIVQDTNWTGTSFDTPIIVPEAETALADLFAISKTSRYAGSVISLAERVRSVTALKQASGDQRGGASC
ncbi:hypothetical protein D3C78_1716050 [compost metagenome]